MNTATHSPLALRKSLLARIHFWAALIASPFAVLACLSGLLYVFTPQIESALYQHIETVQPQVQQGLELDLLLEKARLAAGPDLRLQNFAPPPSANAALKLQFVPLQKDHQGHAGHEGHGQHAAGSHAASEPFALYLNPYTGEVTGKITQSERFSEWAASLHSSLLLGENWRWMIELAASWMLVMLISGIYLWWPRGAQSGLPQSGATGRAWWRQWHALLGVLLSLLSLIILLTGITWSKYAGEEVRYLRDISGQRSPQVPKNLRSIPQATALSAQQIWQQVQAAKPGLALLMTPPKGEDGVWRIGSASLEQPQERFDLLLDQYSGQTLYSSGWAQQTAFGKATTVGIPFHRGEFGWWNQALLFVFALGVLFSILSGWVMCWQRLRSAHAQQRRLLPRLLPRAWRAMPLPFWLGGILLLALLPLLAISAGVVLLLEVLLLRRAHPA